MNITESNYFSLEAEKEYMSNHLWSMFQDCEAKATAYLNGKYKQPDNDNFKIGLYVEAMLQNRNLEFISENPDIFAKDGKKLLAKFEHCETMYKRAKRDSLFDDVCKGECQEIFKGQIAGMRWKCKTDFTNHEKGVIIDLKTTADFDECWMLVNEKNQKVAWYEVYNYWRQMAIQRELVKQNKNLSYVCIIAAITKQKPPDLDILEFDNEKRFQLEIIAIENRALRIKEVWQGREKPISCGKCDYCRDVKELKAISKAGSIY